MKPLSDTTALVTGASAGIGEATARKLADAGARVVLCARRVDRLERLASELPGAEVVALDVRDAAAVQAALGDRRFDVVVNNAGLGRGLEPMHEGEPDEWREMLETNVLGVLHVLRATMPGMVERGSGDHVFLGSVAGFQVYPGGGVYCATKHAVRAIYEAARLEVTEHGVRTTLVSPGMVETEFSVVRFRGDESRASAVYEGMRPITADDVADSVLYAVTRPENVDIGEIVLWSSDQTSTTKVRRR